MNKQEFIKHIEDLPYKEGSIVDKIYISRKGLLELVKQLDEPQKPVVPQFVVDWIKYCKNTNVTMTRALLVGEVDFYNYANQKDISRLTDFFSDGKNQEIFARAWLDGYELEEEKRDRVKMKGIEEHNGYLKYNKNMKHWYFGSLFIYNNDVDTRTYHTRKQLEEDGFGWVFDCPGIEVLEVED